MFSIRDYRFAQLLLHYTNCHKQGSKPNIFIFSTPRSGSTWIKELIGSQAGIRFCNEPFNLRNSHITRYLNFSDWSGLYAEPLNPRILDYLDAITAAHRNVAFFNPFPFRQYYRVPTDRTVYKVLHALEDRMGDIEDRYNAKMVLLLRHPLAVSLSRKHCPRLSAMINSDFSRHFSESQLVLARSILKSGSEMEKLVLSWCLQNAVMLRHRRPHWLTVTYEQLTLESDTILDDVCRELELDNMIKLKSGLGRASGSSDQSDAQTRELLESESSEHRSQFLVEKWRKSISPQEENHLMSLLLEFDIDAYKAGSVLPSAEYWINS